MANGNRSNGNKGTTTLLTVLVIVAVLYFARTVFIPFSLAVLFSFLLGPLVIRFRRWGFGRIPSVLVVVLFSFTVLGMIGFFMVSQVADLGHKLPEYQQNVQHKLDSIRESGGGLVTRLTRAIRNVTDEITPPTPAPGRPGEEKPVPVEVRRLPFSPFAVVQTVLGSLVSVALMAGIVIVFVIFMLIEREDLRDRFIRLAGARRINLTTKLLDDAAQRVSRYLLAQLCINCTFGLAAGMGLYLMGAPNPVLWGILATLLRYIPYLGIWIAALLPAALLFAVEPGWLKVPLVFGMYFGIDLCMYNFAEPVFYGSSTGLSPLAILVAAVFWTWLWGAVGLLLAIPLTVCVVVIGHHVPNMGFLRVLLSDEPSLQPHTRFYQRMLAMDLEDATAIAEEFLKGRSLEALYDDVLIPALVLAEEDRHRGKLDEVRQQFLFHNTRVLVDDLGERASSLIAGENQSAAHRPVQARAPESEPANSGAEPLDFGPVSGPPTSPRIICVPVRDEADDIAAAMLVQLLARKGVRAGALPSRALAGEALATIARQQANIICVLAVPPFGYMHARYLCRRLESQHPDLKVVAAILTERDASELKSRQPALEAEEVAASLQQALAHLVALTAVEPQPAGAAPQKAHA